jgi:transcriptional regulator with XRE-family HTH domain
MRAERRLSLRQVEERGGPNKDTMSLIERGVHKPYAQTFARIAHAFDMSVAELRSELEAAERPKVPAPLSQERLFNNGLTVERRTDYAACAGALDHFSGYWWGAVTQGRVLDRQQLAEFVESVRTVALLVRELTRAEREQLGVRGKWTEAERERSALWPSIQRFVAVVQQVPDLAQDEDAAASELADALQPLAA